jgi:hypothetical protein
VVLDAHTVFDIHPHPDTSYFPAPQLVHPEHTRFDATPFRTPHGVVSYVP